ncbi:hypothetical protein CISG_07122 [Coccidioides immitis RMSCC 3703]|uniref:Fatty acid hydroxylase domain-containing protein n=1 Tax=Coccidioides immitis RMSCC 3703 TaxID=454286 RepID=A0A0J8R243_COCIT|nr:hypothetical protein CISG_07122 [Coccidioides immitis RMSCC 3703]
MLSCLGLVFGNQLFLIASHFFLLRISNYELTPFRMDSQLPSILEVVINCAVAVFDAAVSHSGYSLFRLPSVENHDIHHEKGNINFGILGVMDWLHGTHAIQYNLL